MKLNASSLWVFWLAIFAPSISFAEILLTETRDNEVAVSSNMAFVEENAEKYTFETSSPNQKVRVSVTIPFTVHQFLSSAQNGAFRVYIDGTAYKTSGPAAGKQWDGYLIANGGAWVTDYGVPVDGRVTNDFIVSIPEAGTHTIHVRFSGSATYTIGTLRSRRFVQVVEI